MLKKLAKLSSRILARHSAGVKASSRHVQANKAMDATKPHGRDWRPRVYW